MIFIGFHKASIWLYTVSEYAFCRVTELEIRGQLGQRRAWGIQFAILPQRVENEG